jgi:plastocyanin
VSLSVKERVPLSPNRTVQILAALAVFALACHCGSSTPSANTITIANFEYSPTNLLVKPGSTVTVANNVDMMLHSVTSQSAPSSFDAGSVAGVSFDTGGFEGTATFTIPSTAPVGTVIPYFCTEHTLTMGQGQITIVAP